MSNIHPPPETTYSLPKVGEIRCYWTLLNSDLQIVYTDPVLTSHLDGQATAIIGHSLLDFVHPEEKESARDDISQGKQDRGQSLWGSVTRVRFCRLSQVRRMLGHTGPPHYWQDAEKIVYDDKYMEVDIVLNWAASDLILCFIHASINLKPADNDQLHKTPWTNWCGTPVMSTEFLQTLCQRLYAWYKPENERRQRNPYPPFRRVFQILANQPERRLLLHWPPDEPNGPSTMCLANAVHSAGIHEDTQDRQSSSSQTGTASRAKTTCTRRFSSRVRMSLGSGGEQALAYSIFIPHGTIIFACHEVTPQAMPQHSDSPRTNATSSSSPTMQLGYPAAATVPHHAARSNGYHSTGSPYYENYPSSQTQVTHRYPPINYASYHTSYPPPPPPSSWNNDHNNSPSSYHGGQWSSPAHSASPLPAPAVSNLRSGPESYATNGRNSNSGTTGPSSPWPASQPPHHSTPPYMESAFSQHRAASPEGYPATSSAGASAVSGGYASASPLPSLQTLPPPPPGQELLGLGAPSGSSSDAVPPSRRRVSPNSAKSDHGHSPYPSPSSLSSTGIPETGRTTGSGRYSKPQGLMKCSSCKATSSPEWRKGPSGKKELCNACGLRYARSRAKKDGQNPIQRKRKEKGIGVKREEDSTTPPSSINNGTASPHNANSYLRGSYGDYREVAYRDCGLPPPTSSPNTEVFNNHPPPLHAHLQPLNHVLNEDAKAAPSPPPSAVGNYLHSKGYTNNVPSPLSANPPISSSVLEHHPGPPSPAPLHSQHSRPSTNRPGSTTQLPPLSYVDRMHSALPSPIAHSPLSARVHTPASYERDSTSRESPLPAGARRSILTGQ